MVQATKFNRGDVVIHTKRPEWGEGVIGQAINITHEGGHAQRLIVDFVNYGRVTLNSAVAPLVVKEAAAVNSGLPARQASNLSPAPAATPRSTGGWLDNLSEPKNKLQELWRMPDSFTDPFLPLTKRLTNTLDSYRWGTDPHHALNILEWAIAQTGLNDPLTRYTRQELEQAFPRFVRDREEHLRQLVFQLKKQSRLDVAQQILQTLTEPLARNALQKAMRF